MNTPKKSYGNNDINNKNTNKKHITISESIKSTVKDIQSKLDSKQKICEDIEEKIKDTEEQ